MIIYWVFILISCLSIGFDFIKMKTVDRYLFLNFIILLMILFSGLRYNSDGDYNSYVEIFNNMPTINEWFSNLNNAAKKETYGEPLFVILCIFIKTLGLNVQWVFFIIAALTFSILSNLVWKIAVYPFTSIFIYNSLFFLAGGFTQIRYGLAIVIVMQGFYFLYHKKVFTYFLMILLGAGFHVTSLIGLLILPFYILKIRSHFILYILIAIGVIISFMDLNTTIIKYFFDIETDSTYTVYLGEIDYLSKAPNTAIVLYSLFVMAFLYLQKNLNIESTKYNMFLQIAVLSIIVGGITIQVNILARFTVLFQLTFIFIIPYLFYYFRYKLVGLLFIIAYCLIKFEQFLEPGGFIREYHNILFQ